MQHIQTPTLPFAGHGTVWRTAKYLAVALAGLIAVIEHSPGPLIVPGIAFFILHTLAERKRKLESESPVNPQASASRLLGDGGSFPGVVPEQEHQSSGVPRMHDGGSL
jgi:hypothetical protein